MDKSRSPPNVSLYDHDLPEGHQLSVFKISDAVFVVICTREGKAGKTALVEHCQRCAWAACFRLESSGKWKELAPEVEEG